MNFFPLLMFLTVSIANAESDNIDLLLKARGLQAVERIEKLVEKNQDSKGKSLSKKERCDWDLEKIYYAFAHPEASKIVKKTTDDKKGNVFIFLVSSSDEDGIGFQISYIYLKKSDSKPSGVKIPTLKTGWEIVTTTKATDLIVVGGPTCNFIFNINDPLDSLVSVK